MQLTILVKQRGNRRCTVLRKADELKQRWKAHPDFNEQVVSALIPIYVRELNASELNARVIQQGRVDTSVGSLSSC